MQPVPWHPIEELVPLPLQLHVKGKTVFGQVEPPLRIIAVPPFGVKDAQFPVQPSPVLVPDGVVPIIPGMCFHG
jgi:hypothetical protein